MGKRAEFNSLQCVEFRASLQQLIMNSLDVANLERGNVLHLAD